MSLKLINSTMVYNIIRGVLSFLLPARCVITGEVVESNDMVSPEGWASLNFVTAPLCVCCGAPFPVSGHDETENDLTCTQCLDQPPVFDKARSTLRYDDVSRLLLLSYKHGDKTHMAAPFSQWMIGSGQGILDETDVIVPVPLHWTRLLKRRYNQAGLLAQSLSRKTGLPVDLLGLKRSRRTKSQGHMKIDARHKNIRGAFIVPDKYRLSFSGKRVALIDDVYTTGVTVNECARVLLDAGALSVNVLCVARTVYD
jgi:ComF family protein